MGLMKGIDLHSVMVSILTLIIQVDFCCVQHRETRCGTVLSKQWPPAAIHFVKIKTVCLQKS